MQEKPLFHYNMLSYHHRQVDTKSDPLAIEEQDWQIAQNIRQSWTLSQENSFSHFTATDDCFSDFEGSSFNEASGLSLTLPEFPESLDTWQSCLSLSRSFCTAPEAEISQRLLRSHFDIRISWWALEVSDFYR